MNNEAELPRQSSPRYTFKDPTNFNIRHTENAFVPGDRVYIYDQGHINGKRTTGNMWRTVSDVSNGILTFVEDKAPKQLKCNNAHIKSNDAWERAFSALLGSRQDKVSADNYRKNSLVSYETYNGELCVVILNINADEKVYCRHSDGTVLKKIKTDQNIPVKYLIKQGETTPLKYRNTVETPSGYVQISPKIFEVDKNGKFKYWKIEYRSAIAKFCPWLTQMPATWKAENWETSRRGCPYPKQ